MCVLKQMLEYVLKTLWIAKRRDAKTFDFET